MSRRRRRIAAAVLEDFVVMAVIGGALWGVSGEWVLGVSVLLGQLGSTLMTYYRVDEGGISVRRGLLAYKIPWGEVAMCACAGHAMKGPWHERPASIRDKASGCR